MHELLALGLNQRLHKSIYVSRRMLYTPVALISDELRADYLGELESLGEEG